MDLQEFTNRVERNSTRAVAWEWIYKRLQTPSEI